ncbi:MAG: chemotaxis protein CheW [Deltaproteobacteria bacterium]|nr:chemotaxis protein CheW [Deltaproteobacteria bacterium]
MDWETIKKKIEGIVPPDGADAPKEEQGRVLRERARRFSAEPVEDEAAGKIEAVEFLLGCERYAIEPQFIAEICELREYTPVPCTPAFVLGIINLRGRILPVVDIRKFFELPDRGLTDLNKVIMLGKNGTAFGILADEIIGVRFIPEGELEDGLPTLTDIRAEYLKGITGDRTVLLDGEKLLADKKITVNDEA